MAGAVPPSEDGHGGAEPARARRPPPAGPGQLGDARRGPSWVGGDGARSVLDLVDAVQALSSGAAEGVSVPGGARLISSFGVMQGPRPAPGLRESSRQDPRGPCLRLGSIPVRSRHGSWPGKIVGQPRDTPDQEASQVPQNPIAPGHPIPSCLPSFDLLSRLIALWCVAASTMRGI